MTEWGATVGVDKPTEEVVPTEEDIMDGPANVGLDTAKAGGKMIARSPPIKQTGKIPWN